VRALIMDQGLDRGSLAGVRALRDDGWMVGVGSPVRGLAGSSRAVARWHEVPAAERGVQDYLEAVRTAVDEGGYDVVFSSDDIGVIALSRYRDGLGAIVPYACHDTVVRSLDKLGMTCAAEASGLAVPCTSAATDDVVERLDAPAIVKPRLHSVLQPGAPGRLETVLARSPEEARDAVAEIRAAGVEAILQEVIRGDLMSFQAVIDRDGRMLAPVQQISPRTWPPDSGSAARGHTVAIDPVLAARVAAFFQRLGWFGLAQLQFIAPHDGGEPRLIDLNGRYYSSLALAIASGPNLPGIWARLATGRALEPIPPSEPGHSYQWFSRDLRASWRAQGIRGAAGTVRISPGSVHSVWRHDDPWPSFHHYGSQLAVSGGRRLHAVAHFLAALGAGSGLV
jgi:predicted ATP-grasp superfamily ATP-dependent carboligase